MRRILVITLLSFFFFNLNAQVNTNVPWIWVNGEKHIPMRPVNGTKNLSAPANNPGGRKHAVNWQGSDGKIWVFGGWGFGGDSFGYLNDLWKYDPAINQWTWVSGDYGVNSFGVYGTQGVSSDANMPGARRGGVSWVGSDGDFYLFGGDGYGINAQGRLNDLWKYNTTTNQWTWVSGPTTVNSSGVFGSQGVSSATNWPGARNGGTVWKDNSNNIWLFGGDGFASTTSLGRLNDLWKYDPSTNQWVWMQGASTINASSGAAGPGGRNAGNMGWKDDTGNFYLFGGIIGTDVRGPYGYTYTNAAYTLLNDLWEYNATTNLWTLVLSGTSGMAAPSPPPREHGLTWTNGDGYLWLFGGRSKSAGGNIELNDLWKFNRSINEWIKIKGDNSGFNFYGIYGEQSVSSAKNQQGGRAGNIGWVDGSGKLYAFGGDFYEGAPMTFRNDIWQYDPSTNIQTWIKGDTLATVTPVDGVQGVADAANRPGERQGTGGWTDNSGNLWLFGGDIQVTLDGPPGNFLNDLWKYNISSGQWALMKKKGNAVYGVKGTPDPNNNPWARKNSMTWTDAASDLWLFGGFSLLGIHNDLWKYDPASNQWTWVSGDNTANKPGVYGIQGIADPNNKPSARQAAANWKDNAGNLWLFGGLTFGPPINDLWKYNIASNQWTWVSGDNVGNQPGSYGILGVPAANNKPGARENSCASWKDNAGNLWLFGGNTGSSYFNDLWKYDIVSNQWTWMNGDNTTNNPGIYGIQGTAAITNKPGARAKPVSWTDGDGNFWLMGGYGYDGAGTFGDLNDLWVYNTLTNQWIWVKGDAVINKNGIYGTKNSGSPLNNPGSRYEATAFKDGAGDFWLFGGNGFGESGESRLSDLWKFASPSLSPLPVHLIAFNGRLVNNDGLLNWKTENEINAASFIIERSTDRRNYTPVGTIAANNRSGVQQYNFTDQGITSLGSSIIYYRLKQTDIDSKATYSNIVALTIDKSSLVFFYPNPVINTGNITITLDRPETIQAKIINQAGAIIKQLQWKLTGGSTSISIDMSALPAGAYYLDLSGETISKRISFIK
jgi:N-acetylneuraminic acid mutarotase